MIQEFHNFLRTERAVRLFQRALLSNDTINVDDSIIKTYSNWQKEYESINPKRYINSSFIFVDKEFWTTMNTRWLKRLRRINDSH